MEIYIDPLSGWWIQNFLEINLINYNKCGLQEILNLLNKVVVFNVYLIIIVTIIT